MAKTAQKAEEKVIEEEKVEKQLVIAIIEQL